MNIPLSKNYNTNQIKVSILNNAPNLSDEKYLLTENIKETFLSNLDYKSIYKNLFKSITYDTWIFDKEEYNNTTQSKLMVTRFVSYPYDTVQFELGDYFTFNLKDGTESNWLITDIKKFQLYDINGKLERCNNTLSFQTKNGTVVAYPCILDSNNGSLVYNGQLTTINSNATLKIQCNENVLLLGYGQRILVDSVNSDIPDVFKIADINTKNVYDGEHGYIVFYLEKDKYNETTDNLTYKVADYKNIVHSTGSASITYSGDCVIKVGGSYKSFSFVCKDNSGTTLSYTPIWTYSSSTGSTSNFIFVKDDINKLIKIKCNDIQDMIDTTLTLNVVAQENSDYYATLVISVVNLQW